MSTRPQSVISSRERSAVVQSLRLGVTPSVGLHHIQVGRSREVAAVLSNLESVRQGASGVRFIVGDYGSGKTFFLQLMRQAALRQSFVIVAADISPERRLTGGGSGQALYRELMSRMATDARPDGGALASCIERWISETDRRVRKSGGKPEDVPAAVEEGLRCLQDLPRGFDFALVLRRYFEGFRDGNAALQDAALRWLRAEYDQKTVARKELNAPSLALIDDVTYFDALKLLGRFVRLAGFSGLLVNIDELGVLATKLQNTAARKANFDALLTIVNECADGRAEGLMFLFASVSDFITNTSKGLYGHDALASRLKPPTLGDSTFKNYAAPVIELEALSVEDRYLLLENVRRVFSTGLANANLLDDDGLRAFFDWSERRLGSSEFQTAREIVRAFVTLLDSLEQQPEKTWREVLRRDQAQPAPKSKLGDLKL